MANSKLLTSVREDDFLEYFIFPQFNINDNEETTLLKYLGEINNLLQTYTKKYIWHKDEFNLTLRRKNCYLLNNDTKNTEILPAHLYGILHYGDNIEDEWFTTFLLHQISMKFGDLIIRAVDSDGEYLLIEAANHLPSWADPDNCEKRVYIYKGKIHILPITRSQETEQVDVSKALEIIHNKSLLTEATTNIQDTILKRISGYPERIKESIQCAKVYIPVAIAAILKHKPGLIAHAVTAFCNRDPIDVKACRAMKYFPPENRVYSRVTFTKCLYAMLSHSDYCPDARTGWNLPANDSPQFKSHILGIKVASGFEILASQAKPSPDLESDLTWLQYLEELKNKGYFKNLLEHSQEYNNLLNTAKDYFKNNRDMLHYNPVLGQQIIDLNKTLDYNVDDLKHAEQNIPVDDDESWMQIDPQQLEQMLEEKYGNQPTSKQTDVVEKLKEFLDSTSGVDGVEFSSEDNIGDFSPVRPQRGIKKNKDNPTFSPAKDDTKINLDASNFSCAVQNILELIIPEDSWDLESGSEMSEYEDEPDMDLESTGAGAGVTAGQTKNKLEQYMDAMDRELADTFPTVRQDKFDDIETFQPVDIDMTVLKNMLESYQAQMGAPGPASNLLGPMGVHLESSSSNSKPDGQ